jgi:KaiC/GvpD/RAD55 family RecA-like ATPase
MANCVSLLPTYVDGLDKALGGGIPKGSTVVVAGTPGTMKTSLVFNMLYHNSHHGSRALYITLEQSAENLRIAMKRFGFDDFNESQIYIVDIGRLRLELNKKEVTRDWIEIIVEIVKEAVNTNQYDLLALDSLDALYSLMGLHNPRRELFHLFGALKELGLTTFLIGEVPFGSNQITEFGEDFLADGILYLKQVELNESDVELRLRCVKMRMVDTEHSSFALLHDGGKFSVVKSIPKSGESEQQLILDA